MNNIFGKRSRLRSFLRRLALSKRQKFIISVLILSLFLFISEHFFSAIGLYFVFFLSLFTDFFLFLSLRNDLKENFSWKIFILPFFYSLAVGMFYLLVPARFLTRIGMTSLYALGLYSLFLSENIFTVSAIRTIQLLSGARTVAFALTLLSYFFLSNVIFSFHINVFITLLLVFGYTLPMVTHSLWMYTFNKDILSDISWIFSLTLCLVEGALLLWFWPSTPTVIALFLSGFFYIIVGLSQVWFEKRLFRSVILEYAWVAIVVFVVLVLFTSWK